MTDTPSTKSAKSARTTAPGPEARTVFVVSPIGKSGTPEYRRAKLVLDFIIKKAFPKPHWTVVRADDEESPDSISTQVIRRIRESDLIVADLSGHNPNVFYELAVAHGYERPVIHMISTTTLISCAHRFPPTARSPPSPALNQGPKVTRRSPKRWVRSSIDSDGSSAQRSGENPGHSALTLLRASRKLPRGLNQ